MTIEERIQELRKSNGLSQEQLAETLGVSRQAVSKWESGQSMPEVEKLIAMSTLFDVTIDYILKGEAPTMQDDNRAAMRLGSQVVSAVATLLLLVGIIACVSNGDISTDIYGGLIIESVGVTLMLIGWFLAGSRIINIPLFVLNILLTGVLPSMMVPITISELRSEALSVSAEWFLRTPGSFLLFTATYIALCGGIIYFTVIRKRAKK